jgi:uncharacterized protein YegJ (DUF2314 family)
MNSLAQQSTTSKASLVLLRRGLWDLDNPLALRNLIWRKFHKKLHICPRQDGDTSDFLTASFPDIFIQFDGFLFQILAVAQPYFADRSAVAARMDELRLRQAVLEHEAYVSITLVNCPEDTNADEAAGMLGKMTAALGSSIVTVAVASPSSERVRLWDKNIRRALCGEEAATALTETLPSQVPVLIGDVGDPDLQAATAEARRRWPQFANAYANKRPDQLFAVKAPFVDGGVAEHMWIKVVKIEDEYLQGVLDNDPALVKKFTRGMRVRLRIKSLSDWMYTDADLLVGGFTNEVLAEVRPDRGGWDRAPRDRHALP